MHEYKVTLAEKTNSAGDENRVTGTIEVASGDDAFEKALEYAMARGQKEGKPYLVVGLERSTR